MTVGKEKQPAKKPPSWARIPPTPARAVGQSSADPTAYDGIFLVLALVVTAVINFMPIYHKSQTLSYYIIGEFVLMFIVLLIGRPLIALGILCGILLTPLLTIGACFTNFAP